MNNLLKLRNEKKMSQLNLAMKIGVDQVTISGYECGKSYPSVDMLLKLCELFNVSSDFLLDKTNVRTPVNSLIIDNFTQNELELLSAYRALPTGKRERALGMLLGLGE